MNLARQPNPGTAFGPLGFYLACYATAPASPSNESPAPDNLAVLSVAEAGTMSFDDFVRLTKQNNAGLPSMLALHQSYQFTTAAGHRFSFWLHQTDHPKSPRVIDLDNRVDDFGTLPLVNGPWMNARGHDGHVEITYPGAVSPLVLDYTDPSEPMRTPDEVAYPQPLVDRARAIMNYALDLVAKARGLTPPANPNWPVDPQDAYKTAVDVFWSMNAPDSVLAEYLWLWGQVAHIRAKALFDAGRLLEAAAAARDGAAHEEAASFAPDAAPRAAAIATELTLLAGILAASGATAEGVEAQQAVVELLGRLAPERKLDRDDATYNLLIRMFDAGRQTDVPPLLPALLDAYRADTTDAAAERVSVDLDNLAKRLVGFQLAAAALDTAQAAVDVVTIGNHVLALAHARQDLIARLVEAGRAAEAALLVAPTLDGYRAESIAPGVRQDVTELVGILTQAGLTAQAAAAQQLLDSL